MLELWNCSPSTGGMQSRRKHLRHRSVHVVGAPLSEPMPSAWPGLEVFWDVRCMSPAVAGVVLKAEPGGPGHVSQKFK